MLLSIAHLNTSYVDIKLALLSERSVNSAYLNTSYVDIKQS